MKFSILLHQRQALLRQAHLANLAFAHERLGEFIARIERGQLRGPVRLTRPEHQGERHWPKLTTLIGNQSVIEEHFSEEDILDFADAVGHALEAWDTEVVFDLSEVDELFRKPVGQALEQAGVQVDESPARASRMEDSPDMHSQACDEDEL